MNSFLTELTFHWISVEGLSVGGFTRLRVLNFGCFCIKLVNSASNRDLNFSVFSAVFESHRFEGYVKFSESLIFTLSSIFFAHVS